MFSLAAVMHTDSAAKAGQCGAPASLQPINRHVEPSTSRAGKSLTPGRKRMKLLERRTFCGEKASTHEQGPEKKPK